MKRVGGDGMDGVIRKLVTDKGFGFIEPASPSHRGPRGKDIFFHASGVVYPKFDDLSIEDKVTFEIEDTDKGPKAVSVSRKQ